MKLGLSPEQLAMRETALGASEVPAVLELSPWASPVDVWMSKATPSRPPLFKGSVDEDRAAIGHLIEPLLLSWFARKTGLAVEHNTTTLRHPDSPALIATPDGIASSGRVVVQVKNVGQYVADKHWANGTPDYVRAQVIQEIDVAGAEVGYVVALLGGSEPFIGLVEPVDDERELLRGAAEAWWIAYVLGDEPPPAVDRRERAKLRALRYDGSKELRDVSALADMTGVIEARAALIAEAKALDAQIAAVDEAMLDFIGDDYGVTGPWGKAIAPSYRGRVDWKAVAEEIAGGPVDEAIAERFRGAATRRLSVYETSKKIRRIK